MAFRMNRKPIGRAPFPRFPIRRRRRYSWLTGIFENVNQDQTGLVTLYSLVDYALYAYAAPGGEINLGGPHKVHRITFKGSMNASFEVTSVQDGNASFLWAVYVLDGQDTAIDLWNAANNAFANHRILKWGYHKGMPTEIPTAQRMDNAGYGIPIQFDLRFRRPVLVPRDSEVVLACQWSADVSPVLVTNVLNGIVRASVQPAGMGT